MNTLRTIQSLLNIHSSDKVRQVLKDRGVLVDDINVRRLNDMKPDDVLDRSFLLIKGINEVRTWNNNNQKQKRWKNNNRNQKRKHNKCRAMFRKQRERFWLIFSFFRSQLRSVDQLRRLYSFCRLPSFGPDRLPHLRKITAGNVGSDLSITNHDDR